MSNATHTPGPWHVDTRLTGHRYNGHPVRYFSVAHTTQTRDCFIATEVAPTTLIFPAEGCDRTEPNHEGEANARLIAAAPELLAALEEQLENTKGDLEAHLEAGEAEKDCAFMVARIEAMSAVIARAKGQA